MTKGLTSLLIPFVVAFVSSCAGVKHRTANSVGKVILVVGSTSCGKSTTAKGLQSAFAKRGIPYALFGADDFMATLPKQWVNLDASSYEETREEGLRLVKADDEKGQKIVLKIGSLVSRLRQGTFVAVNAIADAGINVILEGVVSEPELSRGIQAFAGKNLLTAYVDCSLQTAQAREKKRGGFIGLARGIEEDFSLPQRSRFDVVVSTDTMTPNDAAIKILEHQHSPKE